MEKYLNLKTLLIMLSISIILTVGLWTVDIKPLNQPIKKTQQDKTSTNIHKLEEELNLDSLSAEEIEKAKEQFEAMNRKMAMPKDLSDSGSVKRVEMQKPESNVQKSEMSMPQQSSGNDSMDFKGLITWIISSLNGLVMIALGVKQIFFKKAKS